MKKTEKSAIILLLLTIFCAQCEAGSSTSVSNGNNSMKDNRPDAAITLLSSFQGTCSSQGAQTASALGGINAFVAMIELLKSTDACKPFINNLTQISGAAGQFQALQNSSSYTTYNTDQQQLSILTLALQAAAPNSSDAQQLATAIQSTRQQMYTDEATYNASQQTTRSNLIASQSASLLSLGQQLVSYNQDSSSPTFDQCLRQSPSAVIEMGANLMSIGGSFLPPVFGSAVDAVAQLISIGTEMFRQGQYDKPVYAAEVDEMPDALSCAMESMSDSWCSTDDSVQLLDLARDNRNPNYLASPLWTGIDIVGRQLPGLVAWLQEVQDGVPPQNISQANNEVNVITEEETVQAGNISTVATLNNAVAQYKASSDPVSKNAILTSNIVTLAMSLSATGTSLISSPSPTIFSSFQPSPYTWACYFINGYADYSSFPSTCPDPTKTVNQDGQPATTQLVTNYVNLLTSNGALYSEINGDLANNWKSVEIVVQNSANSDFARTINTNAGSLIPGAAETIGGNPVTPLDVLRNISSFIQAMIDYNYAKNPQLPDQLVIEKAQVDQAIYELTGSDAAVCPPQLPQIHIPHPVASTVSHASLSSRNSNPTPSPSPSLIPVSPADCQSMRLVSIFELFGLQNGTQVFSGAVQDLVSFDLQNRFNSTNFPLGVQDILKAAGLDFSIRLQEAGLGDLDPMTEDLGKAKGDYETTIRSFRNFFVKTFNQAVQHESVLTKGEDPAQGPDRPHGQKLAQLCLFWLETANIPGSSNGSAANWPGSQTQQICDQALYYNGNDAPDASGKYTPTFVISDLEKTIGTMPFEKRVCTFHNYKIHNRAKTYYAGQ